MTLDFGLSSTLLSKGFVFLKNDLAILEVSLIHYAMMKALGRGYAPVTTPEIARDSMVEGCGFHPRDMNANPIYKIRDQESSLVGTSEIALAGLYANKIIRPLEESLPVKMCGFSHAFRKETSQRGLYRLHQFSKVELFVITTAATSAELFDDLVKFQCDVLEDLKLPYRVLEMSSHELGLPAHRKIDCEVYMPSHKAYGEVSSASNCTDFQARRLEIRYQVEVKKNMFAHTLNATALAVPRIIMALIENHYDKKENVVRLPKALHALMGTEVIPRKT